MRLHILSDLHQEFGERDVPSVDCDAVVLAGDVGTKMHGLEWIQRRFPEIPVLYICGNHEFYGEKLPSLTEKLRAATEGTNIHFLENPSVTIGDTHFFGATLWTDLALLDDWRSGATEAKAVMNDYKRIRHSGYGYRRLSPWDTRAVHLASVRALREFLTTHDPKRSVVITHHAPSVLSLPEHRRTEAISCAYASHLDALILEFQPRLWVHGHIHHSNEYQIGETRILANPRAYPDKPNPNFQPELVVDLP